MALTVDLDVQALLAALPTQVTAASITSNATALTFTAMIVISLACWVGQFTTGYWSWVDRVWSIAPAAYAVTYALYDVSNQRLMLMAMLTCVWAARLTANFARKGGYGDEEDYRWPILRKWFAANDPLHPVGREVFSFSFVAVYQNVLLWLFAAPQAFIVAQYASTPLGPLDWLLAGAFVVALLLETVTDEQQWAFQTRKYALAPSERARAGGDIARGFCTTGVFAYSRHLNFLSEQSMWWLYYGFTVAAGGTLLNWSALGPLLLTGLFQGSTWMTELLSVQKYPAYAAYQRTTSRLLPWLPGPPLDSPEGVKLVENVTRGASAGAASSSSHKRRQ